MFGRNSKHFAIAFLIGALMGLSVAHTASAADQKPNIVMLMTDDTGWNDFGAYSGEARVSAIQRRISIASPRRAPIPRAGTARRVAQRDGPRSLPGAFLFAPRSLS